MKFGGYRTGQVGAEAPRAAGGRFLPGELLCGMVHRILLLLFIVSVTAYGQRRQVLLDADTANEVDDPFAIARMLLDTSVEVIALNATQWEASHYSVPNSALESHRLNEAIVGYLGLNGRVPLRMGGANRMYDWGDLAQHSAAAYEIIRRAEALPEGQRLPVVALGALTNVASAVFIAPAIAPKLELYWLGSTYDFAEEVMRQRDFNCVMDIQALQVVLDSEVALHVLPVSVAKELQFTYAEVRERLPEAHPFTGFLLRLWEDHRDDGRLQRTLWDIGIVELFLRPELGTAVEVPLPAANGGAAGDVLPGDRRGGDEGGFLPGAGGGAAVVAPIAIGAVRVGHSWM